jgi:two-component system chemotaxis response regulator CheY
MHPTLLFVDDCSTIRATVRIALEGEPFNVELADNGLLALGKIQRGLRPDVIISDLNMPQMGGFDFLREVKALLPTTPVLMMSVDTLRPLRDEARAAGAAGWLVKPFRPQVLIDAIQRVLPAA